MPQLPCPGPELYIYASGPKRPETTDKKEKFKWEVRLACNLPRAGRLLMYTQVQPDETRYQCKYMIPVQVRSQIVLMPMELPFSSGIFAFPKPVEPCVRESDSW